jgi:hypothetical protein
VIYEDGFPTKIEKINSDLIDAVDTGALDIVDISKPQEPKLLVDPQADVWEVLQDFKL